MRQLLMGAGQSWLTGAKAWASELKHDVVALWLAARDARTPLPAKIVAACVAGYALSPIDLIPDFIPVLGYLDDLLLVPLGIMLVVRLIPPALMAVLRAAARAQEGKPVSRVAAVAVALLWLTCAATVASWLWPANH